MALPESGSRLLHALGFAIKSREGQPHHVRADISIEHSIEAAELLDKVGISDTDTLVAVVVHPAVANGSAQPSDIERLFGASVRALVDETTPPRELAEGARLDWSLRRLPSAGRSARSIQLARTVVTLRHLPPSGSMAQRASYLEWVGRFRVAAAGTNAALEKHLGDALRLARSTRASEPLRAVTPVRLGASDAAPPQLADYLPELCQLRSLAGRVEEKLGDLIASAEEGSPRPARLRGERPVAKRARKYSDPKFKEDAKPGVRSVTWRVEDDGTIQVSIDGGKEFSLSPALADLLAIITRTEAAPDGIVAFQTMEDVVAAMRARRGHSDAHAVTVAISRLRDRLYALNYAPLLVERTEQGVRFRLRAQGRSPRTAH